MYPPEKCPHCDQHPTANRVDEHIRDTHSDLPDCTSRISNQYGLYTCAFRVGHKDGEYGHCHASRWAGPMGRMVWADTTEGATPHRGAVAVTGQPSTRASLRDELDALRKRSLTQLGELGIAQNRLDHIRDAARLHRQQLIGTSELYAVIEALDGAPTAAQEEQAAPVDWQDIAKRRERELKTVGEARHRAEAALTRVRELHQPVQHLGRTWCRECSVRRRTGPRAEEWVAFIPHPCPTLEELDGEEQQHSAVNPAATGAAEPAMVTDPAYLHHMYAQAIRNTPARYPDDIATAVLAVRDRHVEQLRQRLRLADAQLAGLTDTTTPEDPR